MGWQLTTLDRLKQQGKYTFVGGPFGSSLTAGDYVAKPGVPVIRGANLDGKRSRFLDEGFVYVTEDKAVELSRNMAFPGDMIFTQRGTLGQVGIIPDDSSYPRYVVSQSQMKVSIDPRKAVSRYVHYYYRSPLAAACLSRSVLATGVPHINLRILKAFPVLLPPLPEQRRIAAILDKADAIRRKRREAIALTESLLRSTFLDMFGDPVANPKGWPERALSQVGTISTGNTPSRAEPANYGDDIEWIKTDNITGTNDYLTEATEWLSSRGRAIGREVAPGAILMACIAGSMSSIGKVSIADRTVSFNQQINAISPTQGKATTAFLYTMLKLGQRRVQDISTGGMKGMVSKGRLSKLNVMVPPLPAQQRFDPIFARYVALRRSGEHGTAEADTLFHALVQRAFRGDL